MVFPLPDKYIDLLTDFGFKRVFGTEPNKALLIDFLNTLLPPHHQIQDVTFKNPEFLGNTLVDRRAIFDIYCQSETGERFIVEMQKAKQNFFKDGRSPAFSDRSVYYSTFPIQEQAQQGYWNYELTAVYTVGILDFLFDDHKHESELLHVVELKNQRCEVFYDKLKFIYVELPKFTKSVDQLETHFDKWLFLLKHLAQLNEPPEPLQEDVFAQLFEVAEIANFSSAEQFRYQDSLKVYRDMNSIAETLIQEGRQQEKQQIAKQMKAAGLPLKDIAQYTGLSVDEIDRL
ncbi:MULTISPECIES: Rpn family recombination-promoting nuclease/putative transposase [Moorena]|nr:MULTISPECIES: Rpn family recombination-promoting nuclease/putative transposase [Moorena]NEP65844.1 Rpn family recombination-promoting nuclease/putative transposase [Moorena sp. SIO3A5]NEQ15282.1 Rpn family recombination-promoting nuclease/putative transposase [Moorena sp. SIO3E2]NES83732.1 Rpn family recombination-promoting nuclease/putative transposase [Moorena sp. SIO2B7]NEP37602.1 Rpn family recombination-promoting nuclease/putative transposase [Moorena sp. SIO3B2]NER88449.1 Rpn family r